jgi:hypothetical protein
LLPSITTYVQQLIRADRANAQKESQSTPSGADKGTGQDADQDPGQDKDTGQPHADSPLTPEGAKFIRDFVTSASRKDGEENITASQVARFRLLGGIVAQPGNDEEVLGAHDANLLYAERNSIAFGNRERSGLVRAGLEHFQSENVPLWHWYDVIGGYDHQILALYSTFRMKRWRVGALNAMTLIEEPLPTDGTLTRRYFLDTWFADDAESQLKSAALSYLGQCGVPGDLPTIKHELSRGDYQTRAAALDAIVRINLREGREKALLELFELQADSISEQLANLLFENPDGIDDGTLVAGLEQRSAAVRKRCAQILYERGKLPVVIAEKLLSDSDAEVRLAAVSSLIQAGRTFPPHEAKRILVKQGAGGLLGSREEGGPQYAAFRARELAAKSEAELEDIAKRTTSVFERDDELALLERRYSKDKAKLTGLIEDKYKKVFDESLAEMASRHGADSDLVKKISRISDHLRQEFVRKAINVICKRGSARDLPFLRKVLGDDDVGYSGADLEYFAQHGEWQDVPLIIQIVNRHEFGKSLLWDGHESKNILGAAALRRLGKGRTPELLDIKMSPFLLARLVYQLSDKEFAALSDQKVKSLLHSQTDRVRKITALKCIRAYTKARLKRTLNDYMSGDQQRYYNVIHWLDLGVSGPKPLSSRAVAKTIAKIWE